MSDWPRPRPGRLLLLLFFLLAACSRPGVTPTPALPTSAVIDTPAGNAATVTPFVLPPTFTPPPPPAVPSPPAPAGVTPTATLGADVDFAEKVVEFRYTIPALGLDRRVEANRAGRIDIVDETTGLVAVLRNQGPIIEQFRLGFGGLSLPPLPEDCPGCVAFSYELVDSGESGEGWLQDPVLLASVENYTAANLGPHFPAGSVFGLRRNANAFNAAHSLAVTADGQLWRWLATDAEVAAPVAVDSEPALAAALAALPALPLADLQGEYLVDCPVVPLEVLYLAPAGEGEGGANSRTIRLICPAFSLPASLLPLYLAADGALAPLLAQAAQEGLEPPPLALPLDTMLDYQRVDGAHLTMQLSGQVVATDPAGSIYTTTLPVSQVISLTTRLAETNRLVRGVTAYTAGELPNILLVRGPLAMLEAAWRDLAPADIRPILVELDALLDEIIGLSEAEPIPPEPTPTATATP